jgi:hypothetical protein
MGINIKTERNFRLNFLRSKEMDDALLKAGLLASLLGGGELHKTAYGGFNKKCAGLVYR